MAWSGEKFQRLLKARAQRTMEMSHRRFSLTFAYEFPYADPPPVEQRPLMSGPANSGTVDLWIGDLTIADWRPLLRILQEEELSRAEAFTHARDARRYVVSHAYLRLLLGERLGTPAAAIRFGQDSNLKPLLLSPLDQPVHFSLSRSGEVTLIGLASAPLGVDIEEVNEAFSIEELVETVLSPREQQEFQALTGEDRRRAFFRCWTQKEAYLKATGDGLHFPLHDVEVLFAKETESGVARISGDASAASGWFLRSMTPRDGFLASVAIRGSVWEIHTREIDPSVLHGP